MKKTSFIITVCISMIFACKEKSPSVDFSEPVAPSKDSTYIVSPAPAPQHKAVLIEDITGVRCSNCPDAAQKAKDILIQKSTDSVVVIAQYPITLLDMFTRPYSGVPQLANEISKDIVESLDQPPGLPHGYVDRNKFTGKINRYLTYTEWINYVNERLEKKTPVNIHLSKELNNRQVSVKMKLQYNEVGLTNSNPHKYAIYLIEDGIVSTQNDHTSQNVNYVHNHVFRYSFGLPLGVPLIGPYDLGKTYVKQFEYEIPEEYVIANCRLVCVVLDGTTQEVINVREIHL